MYFLLAISPTGGELPKSLALPLMLLVVRTGNYIANDTNVSIIEIYNKRTIERIATIALAAFLVGVFCYQVAYGLSLTQVTTNASYKYGFNQGKSEWGSCSDADGDCQTGLTDCQSPSYSVYNYTTGYYNTVPNSAALSNKTACIDGWVNGWNHVCNQTMARSWPNNEIICPITHGRALMNTIDGGHPHI